MFDTNLTPITVLETSAVNATSDTPIEVKPTTKSTTFASNTYACFTNDNDINDDEDQVVLIPPGMFDTDPCDSPTKVKPIKDSTPTRVSNTYACLINDNDDKDDDEEAVVNRTVATKQAPTTGNKMISQQMDELDDNDDDVNEPPPIVVVSDIPNTVLKKNLSTTEKMDLGNMININKGMP